MGAGWTDDIITDPVSWEQRVSDAWVSLDKRSEENFLSLIETLATELPPDSGIGVFERAASLDSTGHPDLAVPLYRQALDLGLTSERRRRAVIQLSSSLRNLDQPETSVTDLRRNSSGEGQPTGRGTCPVGTARSCGRASSRPRT